MNHSINIKNVIESDVKIIIINGSSYDLSNSKYTGSRSLINIKCLTCCSTFNIMPSTIIRATFSGCPECDKLKRFEHFYSRSLKIHNKYEYIKTSYVNHSTKMDIICQVHGLFRQTPNNHMAGNGCPQCPKKRKTIDLEKFFDKCNEQHNYKYDYSKSVYIDNKISVICKTHGEFKIDTYRHSSGQGCPQCGKESFDNYINSIRYSKEDFTEKAKLVHGDKYDYINIEYKNITTKINIICPMHGLFKQTPGSHLNNKTGCPKCGTESSKINNTITNEEFIKRSINIHNGKYNYHLSNYYGIKNEITITCSIHGPFTQRAENHLNGSGCPECSKFISSPQNRLIDFIKSVKPNIEIFSNYKSIITGNYEIDIWIPTFKLGIEYHGSYWHSASNKIEDKRFMKLHSNKANESDVHNFNLLQIYDFEYPSDIWKSIIKNKLNISLSIFARKLKLIKMNSYQGKKFFDENHLQGNNGATVIYGLTDGDVIYCSMSFIKKDIWEIQRFSNAIGVPSQAGCGRGRSTGCRSRCRTDHQWYRRSAGRARSRTASCDTRRS